MIFLSQLANTKFLHLFSLIFLPPSTPLIIIFFYLASLLTLVSPGLHFLSSHLIFPIAPSLFPFNLTSLLLLPSPLASLRVQFLAPLLFCLYTSPLTYLFSNSPVSYYFYADDTQLYISFSSSDSLSHLSILSSTLDSVFDWFSSNRLSVNPSKTEFLLIGTPQQRSKLTSSTLTFQGTPLSPVSSCRNLGVILDNDLSFKRHISSICSSSFYHIRQLRQVRSSLDRSSAIVLANSLVSSKLDYCNSLFNGLPDLSLHRLQLVQNALARVVVPTVRRSHHISPTLRSLHWLPIPQRIAFKIASITFKTLQNNQPSYLHHLLIPYNPPHSLRSSDQHLLTVPFFKSSQARRSFLFAASTIWNSLPLALRTSSSSTSFHSALKTHLFSLRSTSSSIGILDFDPAPCISLLWVMVWAFCEAGVVGLFLCSQGVPDVVYGW